MGIVNITDSYALDTALIAGIKISEIDDAFSVSIYIDGGSWDRVAVFESREEAEALKQAIWLFVAVSDAERQAENEPDSTTPPPFSIPNPFSTGPAWLSPPLGPPKTSSPQSQPNYIPPVYATNSTKVYLSGIEDTPTFTDEISQSANISIEELKKLLLDDMQNYNKKD